MAGTLDRFYEKYGKVSSEVSTTGVQRSQSSSQKKEKGTLDKFYEKYGALHRQSFQDDFDSKWNQYHAGYQHTMQTIQEDLAKADYGNIGDLNKRYSEYANGLIAQYGRLKTLLEGGRDNFTEEDYRRYSDFLEQSQADLGEQMGRLGDYTRFYGQFGSEEEYEQAKSGIGGQVKQVQPVVQKDQAEKMSLEDYAPEYDWTDANQRKKVTKEIDRLIEAEDADTYARYQDMITGLSEKDRKALEDSHGKDSSMAYGYLLQKGYSREDINAMYETLKREKTAELSDDALQSVYDWTGKNAGTAAAGFAGARAGNLAGAVTGTFQTINDTARHYLQGSPYHGTDPNAA
ncbi:MAG: hypothetical protein SPD95_11640, partial [Candidatus Faecousia sp.]|nr:hypothetical protein [Candidatus Faecousia sp.]